MSVPDRETAAALLLELDPPAWAVRHARAVAEVAAWLAARIDRRGTPVDRRLVESAALLHDVDKLLPPDDPMRALAHGDGSAAWLSAHGYPELGRAVQNHPVTRLADETRYRQWAAFASREERIVAYADKRATQRLVSMDERFADWLRRHRQHRPGGRPARPHPRRAPRVRRVRRGRRPAERGRAAALDERGAAGRPGSSRPAGGTRERDRMSPPAPAPTAPLAYFFGDDVFSIERAAAAFGRRVGGDGPPLQRWLAAGQATSAAAIGERVATGALFGGGTLAVVADPAPLIRSKAGREALAAVFPSVAPGNALVFLDALDRWPKDGRLTGDKAALAGSIEAAGGEVRGYAAPTQGGMARWIEDRASERGMRLDRGAAQVLAERVGAFVREGDVDRRRQGQLAVQELEKLALYRLDGPVSADDVRALVAEAVPASTWALLDADRLAPHRRCRRPPRAGARRDAGAGRPRPAPPPVARAHRGRRPRGRRDAAARAAADAQAPSVPRRDAGQAGGGLVARRARRPRSTACSSSTRSSRAPAARRSASARAGWRSRSGWRRRSRRGGRCRAEPPPADRRRGRA